MEIAPFVIEIAVNSDGSCVITVYQVTPQGRVVISSTPVPAPQVKP